MVTGSRKSFMSSSLREFQMIQEVMQYIFGTFSGHGELYKPVAFLSTLKPSLCRLCQVQTSQCVFIPSSSTRTLIPSLPKPRTRQEIHIRPIMTSPSSNCTLSRITNVHNMHISYTTLRPDTLAQHQIPITTIHHDQLRKHHPPHPHHRSNPPTPPIKHPPPLLALQIIHILIPLLIPRLHLVQKIRLHKPRLARP